MSENESSDDCNINTSKENVIKEINDVLERHGKQEFSSVIEEMLNSKETSKTFFQVIKYGLNLVRFKD